MVNLLKHKYYPTLMYLFITITLILILFNFIDIIDKAKNNSEIVGKNYSITGFAISDENLNNITNATQSEERLYSEKTYALFYLIIIVLLLIISFIALILIMPRIKYLT